MMTVWCVDGYLFKGFVDDLALVRALPGEKVQFAYNNTLATEANIGAAARDLRSRLTDGDTCVGVSMGAQVLCRLLRDLGTTKEFDDLRFVLLANPEHAVTGRVKTPQYGGSHVGPPVDTPYDVIDGAVQYDYWADAPTSGGVAAWLNSLLIGNTVHTTGYFGVTLTLDHPHRKRGGIKDMWIPHPCARFLPRAQVEKSYARPVSL